MIVNLKEVYEPTEAQQAFHSADTPYICFWGGADSGKSWAADVEGNLLSYDFPGNVGIVSRWSYRELIDSTMPKFIEWSNKLGILIDEKKADMKAILSTRDPNKTSEVLFRSVDKPNKFGSTEIGWFLLEEAQDPRIKEQIFLTLIKRMRLDKSNPDILITRGMVVCNPPTPDHWVYRYFWPGDTNIKYRKLIRGLSHNDDYGIVITKTTDNVNPFTQVPNYNVANTEKLRRTLSPAWQAVFLDGKPAFIPVGLPVWSNFGEDNKGSFEPIPNRRVIRIWDFGRRRSCVLFAQVVRVRSELTHGLQMIRPALDRAVFLRELIFENKTTYRMAEEVMAYSEEEFKDFKFEDIGDIAGKQHHPEDERSSFDILKEEYDLKVKGNSMNNVREKCIMLLDEKLAYKVSGVPLLQVDEFKCPILTEALAGGWTRNEKGEPNEDNYYEHPSDCALYLIRNYLFRNQRSVTPININVPKYGTTKTYVSAVRR